MAERASRGIFARGLVVTTALLPAFEPAPGVAQWVEPPGEGWVQLTLYHQDTDEQFDFDGEVEEIFADGEAITTAVFLTAAFGVLPGVDLWAQIPWQRLEFNDGAGDRQESGPGDPRFHVRVAPLSYLGSGFPFALRVGVKLEVAEVLRDAEIIPLGEGQRDWELMGELGHSFWPRSVYVMGWVGYRWRERDDELQRDFGDEVFFLTAVGGALRSLGGLGYKLTLEGLYGRTPEIEGLELENARREMTQVTPTLSYPVGLGRVEVGGRFPFQGRNLPAGSSLVLGWFAEFDLFGRPR